MFLTYLRRELRRRMRQAIFIALGLALGIGLVITVTAASSGCPAPRAPCCTRSTGWAPTSPSPRPRRPGPAARPVRVRRR